MPVPGRINAMELTTKQKLSLSAFVGYLFAVALDPLLTVLRLNVENWATDHGYSKLYDWWPAIWLWRTLVTVWEAFTGSWGLGVVCGLLAFSFWDWGKRGLRWPTSSAQEAPTNSASPHPHADSQEVEALRERLRVLEPLAAEAQRLGPRLNRLVAIADREEAQEIQQKKDFVLRQIAGARKEGPRRRAETHWGAYTNDMREIVRQVGISLLGLGVTPPVYQDHALSKVNIIKQDAKFCTLQPGDEERFESGLDKQWWYILMAELDAYEEIIERLPSFQAKSAAYQPQ
jgi:hypothetical protein